jgi:hypothetical protein
MLDMAILGYHGRWNGLDITRFGITLRFARVTDYITNSLWSNMDGMRSNASNEIYIPRCASCSAGLVSLPAPHSKLLRPEWGPAA